MIYLLDSTIGFPDPKDGEPDGLFAVGGDLSTQRLLLAYSWGIFPWYAFRAEDNCEALINPDNGKPYIQWWCPMKRFVIFPNEIHISHSMRQQLNKVQQGELRVTFDTDFRQVIDQCGKLREDGIGAWLGQEMKDAYTRLHDEGYATSVEVWKDDTLVGGLYGVTLGKGFFGEDCPHHAGSCIAAVRRSSYRLPVRNAASQEHGWPLHRLRRIPETHSLGTSHPITINQ